MHLHFSEIGNCDASVQCCQEANIPLHKVTTTKQQMEEYGADIHLANATELSSNKGQRKGHRVAIVTKGIGKVTTKTRYEEDANYNMLMDSGRWMEMCIPIEGGNQYIVVANLYGISGASGDDDIKRDNDNLIAMAIARMMMFKNVPYYLCTDANISKEESDILKGTIREGIVHDIFAEWENNENLQTTY